MPIIPDPSPAPSLPSSYDEYPGFGFEDNYEDAGLEPTPTPGSAAIPTSIELIESKIPPAGSPILSNLLPSSDDIIIGKNSTIPLETAILTDIPGIKAAVTLPNLRLFPKYLHAYLLPLLHVILPPFTQTNNGKLAGHIALPSTSNDVTSNMHTMDCSKEFWIESSPSTTCATLIVARLLGLSVVLLGWASKIPQIYSLLTSSKARMDLPLIPTLAELFGWMLMALYNTRIEIFWTAFGEGYGVIVANTFLMILWGMQQLKGYNPSANYIPLSTLPSSADSTPTTTPTTTTIELPHQYSKHVILSILGAIGVFYYFAWVVLWKGPIMILQGFLAVNAPVGLIQIFTLMYTNYSRKRADSIPGMTIIMGWMCGLIRSYTSFIESNDILLRTACIAGLILPSILVWQIVWYEYIRGGRGTSNPKKAS